MNYNTVRDFFDRYEKDEIVDIILRFCLNTTAEIQRKTTFLINTRRTGIVGEYIFDFCDRFTLNPKIFETNCIIVKVRESLLRETLNINTAVEGYVPGCISNLNMEQNSKYLWIISLPDEIVILGKLTNDMIFNVNMLNRIFSNVHNSYRRTMDLTKLTKTQLHTLGCFPVFYRELAKMAIRYEKEKR